MPSQKRLFLLCNEWINEFSEETSTCKGTWREITGSWKKTSRQCSTIARVSNALYIYIQAFYSHVTFRQALVLFDVMCHHPLSLEDWRTSASLSNSQTADLHSDNMRTKKMWFIFRPFLNGHKRRTLEGVGQQNDTVHVSCHIAKRSSASLLADSGRFSPAFSFCISWLMTWGTT